MNKLKKYVPVLRTKKGEFEAIKKLSLNTLSKITPLFDIHKCSSTDTLDDHINKIISNFVKYYPNESLFLLDCSFLKLDSRMENGDHPFEFACNLLKEKNMIFSPVISLDKDQNCLDVIFRFYLKNIDNEIFFRLRVEDLEDTKETSKKVNTILSICKKNFIQANIIVDLEHTNENKIDEQIDLLADFNLSIPFNVWKSFTLISSSFPQKLADVTKPDARTTLKRHELILWQRVIDAWLLVGRKPRFGDYVIQHPIPGDLGFVLGMNISAKIRHTTQDSWEVFRGEILKKKGYSQYRDLARKLIGSSIFCGEGYSWGADYIKQCAGEIVGTGNTSKWVQVDTNHHLTLVAEQVANFDDFSDID